MRHYQLVPVRYNEHELLVPCEPVDAELWSIQWHLDKPSYEMAKIAPDLRQHWFADLAPTEYETAQALVKWLNNVEQMKATLPPELYAVSPSRSR